jgi:hypothetical protein
LAKYGSPVLINTHMKATCPICFEEYSSSKNQPKAFPNCCHSICLSCLSDMFKERNAVVCPFKCSTEGIPVYKEPGDLTTNKILVDLSTDKSEFNLCGNCKYPYYSNLRYSMMLKFCGHSMCNLCVKSLSNPNKNTDYMICPFDGMSKYSNDAQALCVSNRDLNSFIEDCDISMGCACTPTSQTNEKDIMYNFTLCKRHCPKCSSNLKQENFKICSIEEAGKVIDQIFQDTESYVKIFDDLSKLKEMANFQELRTKIDRIKDKFSKSIADLVGLFNRISSEMSNLSTRIKSLLSDFKIEEKVSIIDEALILKAAFVKIDRSNINDSLRTGIFINQNYDILLRKFKNTITSKSLSDDVHTFKLKTDLTASFLQCFDEFKAYNKSFKDITDSLNVTLTNSKRFISNVGEIRPLFDYKRNPFYVQSSGPVLDLTNKTVINMFD